MYVQYKLAKTWYLIVLFVVLLPGLCMQVTATDWDEKDNARLQYSILGNLAWQFHVDQRGVLSAHTSIDREKYDAFRFPILAVDMGSPPRTGSALIVITIEDVNDEKPRFTQVHMYNCTFPFNSIQSFILKAKKMSEAMYKRLKKKATRGL